MKTRHVLGIGIDIVNVSRFEKLNLSKTNTFLNRIFTTQELDYCFSKKNIAASLATKYAGKEAVIKAFSLTSVSEFDYKEIEILNTQSGTPIVHVQRKKTSTYQVMISLSNESDKTVAVAIVMGY